MKKTKKEKQRLTLKAETVRVLDDKKLAQVNGGDRGPTTTGPCSWLTCG